MQVPPVTPGRTRHQVDEYLQLAYGPEFLPQPTLPSGVPLVMPSSASAVSLDDIIGWPAPGRAFDHFCGLRQPLQRSFEAQPTAYAAAVPTFQLLLPML